MDADEGTKNKMLKKPLDVEHKSLAQPSRCRRVRKQMTFFEKQNTQDKMSKIHWEFMCFLSDESMYTKVMLFGAVSPQMYDKNEKMFIAEKNPQKKNMKIHWEFMCFQGFKENVFKQFVSRWELSLFKFSHQPVLYIIRTVLPTSLLSGYLFFQLQFFIGCSSLPRVTPPL